jgi:[ribosomal protein S5]-alanine N-acetyltransferase
MNLKRGALMQENTELSQQTERLILREFREEDWEAVHEYGSNPETVKYMPFGPNTVQMTRDFLKTVLDNQKAQPRLSFDFALINKIDNKLIGSCRIKIANAGYKEGELGYILNRQYWNQGYMSEAAGKVMAFGFEQLGLHRIYAACNHDNTGSYRVMEKNGMRREGLFRECELIKGVWCDFLLYSILDHEWRARREKSLLKTPDKVDKIEYIESNQDALDLIRPLWQKLIEHHKALSRYFKDHYSKVNFDMRKEQLLNKSAGGKLQVDLARDPATGAYVGYCVTSLNSEKQGEIESIFVEKDYRGYGVGERLMTRAMGWLETMAAKKIILGVGEGNENVFSFYRRFGFYPRSTILELIRGRPLRGGPAYRSPSMPDNKD